MKSKNIFRKLINLHLGGETRLTAKSVNVILENTIFLDGPKGFSDVASAKEKRIGRLFFSNRFHDACDLSEDGALRLNLGNQEYNLIKSFLHGSPIGQRSCHLIQAQR